MAYFAEIGRDNRVRRVIAGDEQRGAAFLSRLLGGAWVQTSYAGTIRKNYAGVGYTYRADLDAFVPPQPFPSWVLDEETAQWQPPTPPPAEMVEPRWEEEYGWVDHAGAVSNVDWVLRFTAVEQAKIIASADPVVQEALAETRGNSEIPPLHPRTGWFVGYLAENSYLDHEVRAEEILSVDPTE